MTTIDSSKINTCWSKIKRANGSIYFVETFYQMMFEKHPEMKALFPVNMKKQNAALLNMMDNVINGIEHIVEFEDILIQLGKRHKNLGVESEMYDVFISIVVESARKASNYTLTDAELFVWEDAFRTVADVMQQKY